MIMTHKMTIIATLLLVVFSLTTAHAQSSASKTKAADAAKQDELSSAFTIWKPVQAEAQNAGEVVRLLQSGNLDETGKITVNNYLQKYFFARWTDPQNGAELGKYRKEVQTLIDSVSNPQGKEILLAQLVSYLYGFATKKEFNPAFRYNAILALGDLDAGQVDGRPSPYPRALRALYQAYNTKDEQDTAREAIRLGALSGIRRHVILGISDAQFRDGQIATLLMDIAKDTPYVKDESANGSSNTDKDLIVLSTNPLAVNTTEPHRTVELHNWFRQNAIETLGYLSGASEPPIQTAIIDTLLSRINDEMELPSIRYQCAYSLSRYNKTIEASPDLLKQTTLALLTLGKVVHDDGIQTMLDEQSTQQTVGSMGGGMGSTMGGGGMSGGGGMGGSMGMSSGGMSGSGSTMGQAQADQINNSLIQIKDGLSSIMAGVQGPDFRSGGLVNSEAVKNMPYHEVLTGLHKTITECVKFLDDGDPEAAKRAKTAQQSASGMGGMGMSTGMGTGMMGTGGTTATVKNQPKVTMKEIEDRLRIVKNDIERLRSLANALDSGVMTASN